MTYNNLTLLADTYDIILGSGSPRRVQLLDETGINFSQITPDINEELLPNEAPFDYALRMSDQKANALRNQLNSNQLAITCDTIVVLDNKVLGKPNDESEALETLSKLSSKCHVVATSIALSSAEKVLLNDIEKTTVYFNNVTENQILEYIKTKEPMDKAGAYGIQGMGAFLVDRIEGNLDNVIGLPRTLLEKMAAQLLDKDIR